MYSVYHIGIDPSLDTGYIGISKNPEQRFAQHTWQRKKSNAHLKNALNKYGDQVFKRILIANLDQELAELCEEMLRPLPNIGWNITKGGGIPPNPQGKERNNEYRKNISKSKIGQLNPMWGKKIVFSDEHKAKLSLSVPLLKCPHCDKEARTNGMKRWHFDRCKNASK